MLAERLLPVFQEKRKLLINMLFNGQAVLFFIIVIALVISLSFHEFGHAFVAKLYGDDTAQRMGRLTLNPLAHIDPIGLMMVIFVGFGYAKPVPTNPYNYSSRWGTMFVSAAGPAMNLILAFLAVNFYIFGLKQGWGFIAGEGARTFFLYLAIINLVLMLFNMIPLAPLDGHHILPYFLSRKAAERYREFNNRYGQMALMGLILLSFVGLPIFRVIFRIGRAMLPYLQVV